MCLTLPCGVLKAVVWAALLCLSYQRARADAASVCAAEAKALMGSYVTSDPERFSSAGCDAVGAEQYVFCDVRASVGRCADAPACMANNTLSVGCDPPSSPGNCCIQHLRKRCPTCEPSAVWCTGYCGPYSVSTPISSYPQDVHDGFCADVDAYIFNVMTRERPDEKLGCSDPSAHAHPFCGVEGFSGLCSSMPECNGLDTTSVSEGTCHTTGAIPSCCSLILARPCLVCETEPVACMQTCKVDVRTDPSAPAIEGSSPAAEDDAQEVWTRHCVPRASCEDND